MTTEKTTPANTPVTPVTPVTFGVPVPPDPDELRQPGEGEVVVTSPTGARSVVSKDAVDSLKTQGYKV
jgi:hypothetical protein